MDNRLASLRRILRIHINWLTVKLLGTELVSKEELAELKDYGRLDLGDEVGLIESSFVLGRISALSKKSEYKDITLEKLSLLKKRKFSSIEKLAIREAKLHASRRLQILSEEAAAGAFARVNKATQDLIADATAKDIIQEELALAIAEKKTRKELAASVGNKLGADLTAGFRKLLVTEMHRAKTRGVAMAISNKVDIYSSSEGAQSIVSVVPNRGACKDCENLYLSETGDPRTFKLSDLVGQGTNADPGISHARTHGLHLGWRPVMPPAHPNCFCELVYVPAGMGWKNGKLVVVDEFKYKEQISKAVDTSTMSATIKPKGAPSNQAEKKASPPSIPGVAAPGNVAGPGATPKAGLDVSAHAKATPASNQATEAAPQSSGPDIEYEYWGTRTGKPPEGKGWEQAPKSKAWRRPLGMGSDGAPEEQVDPKQAAEEHKANMSAIKDYSHDDKTDQETLEHAESGEIISQKDIGEVEGAKKGVTVGTQKCGVKGNGSICTKPAARGMGGEDVQNEQTAARSFKLFGSKLCPVTGSRYKDGKLNSSQAWCNDHSPAAKVAGSMHATEMLDTLKAKSPDWEKVRGQIEEMTVNDLVICNTDRHLENFLLNDEMDDIRVIDHGYSFGKGFLSMHVEMFDGFHSKGMDLNLDPTLNERFSNTSFGDMKKAYGSDTHEWKTAQSYMRMRYVQHVASENEGKLPWEEFKAYGGGVELNANQKFEKFVHDFIDNNIDDVNSPDHATATIFAREGILMPSDVHHSDAENRKLGNHFRYEMASRRFIAEIEQVRRGEQSFLYDARVSYEKEKTALLAAYEAEAQASNKESSAVSQKVSETLLAWNESKTVLQDALEAIADHAVIVDLMDKRSRAEEVFRKADAKREEYRDKERARYEVYEADLDEVRNRLFGNVVPPGQEKAFARINAQLDNLSKPVRERQPTAAPPAAQIAESAAAGIERTKRADAVDRMKMFEKILKKKEAG